MDFFILILTDFCIIKLIIFKIYMNCSEEMDMRLDKYLAEAGVGRRKDVREYIKQGLVMVNGEISIQPTLEIKEGIDIILYDLSLIHISEPTRP